MADNKTLWTKYGREYIWNPCLSTFVGGTFSCHIRSRHCSRCADYFNSDHIRRNLQCPLQFPCKGEDSWLFHGVCLWIHVKCRFRQTVTRLINHLHLPFSISHSLTFNSPGLQSPPPLHGILKVFEPMAIRVKLFLKGKWFRMARRIKWKTEKNIKGTISSLLLFFDYNLSNK